MSSIPARDVQGNGLYAPEFERTVAWNDPDLKIDWELEGEPIVSAKDRRGTLLRDAETFG